MIARHARVALVRYDHKDETGRLIIPSLGGPPSPLTLFGTLRGLSVGELNKRGAGRELARATKQVNRVFWYPNGIVQLIVRRVRREMLTPCRRA